MTTIFDGVVTPLKIDVSTGDAITPREVRYSFRLMLEDRSIDICLCIRPKPGMTVSRKAAIPGFH